MSNRHLPGSWALGAVLVIFLLHLPTFFAPHREGDEMVYLTLAKTMNWNMSNYTTQDDPIVSGFPQKLYRSPLFIHPPLYPMLLKIGSLVMDPIFFGLFLGFLVHVFCAFATSVMARSTGANELASTLVLYATAICPILTISTSRIHIDGILGLFTMLTVFSWINLFKNNGAPSKRAVIMPGIFLGIALNLKMTAVLLPANVFLLAVFAYYRRSLTLRSLLKKSVPPLLLAFVIGGAHYVHLFLVYGSVYPSQLFVNDRPLNAFLKALYERNRAMMLLCLMAGVPVLLVLFSTSFWKKLWSMVVHKAVGTYVLISFLFLFVSILVIIPGVERYWALCMPLFYVSLGLFAGDDFLKSRVFRALLPAVACLMLMTAFYNNAVGRESARVIPALLLVFPSLQAYYL